MRQSAYGRWRKNWHHCPKNRMTQQLPIISTFFFLPPDSFAPLRATPFFRSSHILQTGTGPVQLFPVVGCLIGLPLAPIPAKNNKTAYETHAPYAVHAISPRQNKKPHTISWPGNKRPYLARVRKQELHELMEQKDHGLEGLNASGSAQWLSSYLHHYKLKMQFEAQYNFVLKNLVHQAIAQLNCILPQSNPFFLQVQKH